MKSEAARALDLTDRKSLFGLRGVGPESEAEACVSKRRVTRVALKSNTGAAGG